MVGENFTSFVFSAPTLAFQFFTLKLCLQISGLRMRKFTWNRFPIKNSPIDSLLTPLWRVLTWPLTFQDDSSRTDSLQSNPSLVSIPSSCKSDSMNSLNESVSAAWT